MNIAFYTQQVITPYTGGIGRVSSILTDLFRHHYGWKVFSIYAESVPASYEKTPVDGSLQRRLHDRWNLRKGIKSHTREAALFLKQNQVDIIIIQTSMDVAKRLKLATKEIGYEVKIITCLHFTPGKDVFLTKLSDIKKCQGLSKKSLKIFLKALFSPFYNPLIVSLTKYCYRNAYTYSDRVCLLSEAYKNTFCQFAGITNKENKLIAIPNPLSFESDFAKEDLTHKQHIALVVGRLSEYEKRISTILSIWSRFEKEYPQSDWILKIVGNGISLNDYKQQAQHLHLKKCYFEGVQNPISYYKESSLFLMTSATEGFPMTLVEAQQNGCVPIAMNSFLSITDIITNQQNGVIVNYGDKETFYTSMLELMNHPTELHKMAENALENCQKYAKENIGLYWNKIFKELKS